jgi:hypothetical protein
VTSILYLIDGLADSKNTSMAPVRGFKKARGVSRSELEALRAIVEQNSAVAERNRAEHEVEFKRIAEIQAKVDQPGAIMRRLLRTN